MIPRVHVIADDATLQREDFLGCAAELLKIGGSALALHLRGHVTTGAVLYDRASKLLPVARDFGSRIVVNDRIDVAMAAGALAVQLGARSLRVAQARTLLGDAALIGSSTHDADEARAAAGEGADYVLAGTVFLTPSHPERSGFGAQGLAEIVRACSVPVVGIGGVRLERSQEIAHSGAYGVAMLTPAWQDGSADVVRRWVEITASWHESRRSIA